MYYPFYNALIKICGFLRLIITAPHMSILLGIPNMKCKITIIAQKEGKIWCICKLCFIRGNYLEIIKQFFLVKFHARFFPNFLSYYLCELKNVYDSTTSVSLIQFMFTLKNMLYLYE